MDKITFEALLLMIGAIYGSLTGLAVNLFYEDINNPITLIMFPLVMIINFLLLYGVLKILHKIK